MNESPQSERSKDSVAWFSLAGAILLPLLCSFLLISAALPVGRKGGSTMAQLFALAEFGCIVGGIVGFSKDSRSSNFGRVSRLVVTLAAGGVGLWWLIILSGLAGMTL